MKPKRTGSSCDLCPLSPADCLKRKHGKGNAKLALVGSIPNREDSATSEPFSGGIGKFLSWGLGNAGLTLTGIPTVHAVCCFTTDQDLDSIKEASSHCLGGLYSELKQLSDAGVTTLLAFGQLASSALGIEDALKQARGSVYDFKLPADFGNASFKVIPTFGPEQIIANHWKRSGTGDANNVAAWRSDLRKAAQIAKEGWENTIEQFIIEPTVDDVRNFVTDAIESGLLVQCDIETTGLGINSRIAMIGLAISETDALVVPLLDYNASAYWSAPALSLVLAHLRSLFSSASGFIFQNGFFDVPILKRNGLEIDFDKVHDTIMMHHTLSPESEHNLGFISSVYGRTRYWKTQDWSIPILMRNQKEVRVYNARDTVVLKQITNTMMDAMENEDLLDFYNIEVKPLIPIIFELNESGILLDKKRLAKFRSQLEDLISEAELKLYEENELPSGFSIASGDHLRWYLYGIAPKQFAKLADLDKKRKGTKIYQTLLELKEVYESRAVYILPEVTNYLEKCKRAGNASPVGLDVDKDGRLTYKIKLLNRVAEIDSLVNRNAEKYQVEKEYIMRVVKFLNDLSKLTKLKKLYSTYTVFTVQADGRVHAQHMGHGTATGRLAVKDPNTQNWPKKRDNDDIAVGVRRAFVAPIGHVFVSCDYVNLEAQLLAFETLDEGLIKVFESGVNLHDENTKSFFKITPEDPTWNAMRRAAKIAFFAGISYGGGIQGTYRKIMTEVPDANMTQAEYAQAIESWMEAHPAYVRWKANTIETVHRDRKLTTGFGRKRIFLGHDKDIEREGLNTLIQSAGASIINRAARRIWQERNERKLHAKFVAQIHDQLVMECRADEEEIISEMMIRQMSTPFEFRGFTRKIGVDCSVGNDFSEL